jgi:hypothetical protein
VDSCVPGGKAVPTPLCYLLKESGINNSLGNHVYTTSALRKRKPWTTIGLFCIHLDFQPKMKNWIIRHYTVYLYRISVLIHRAILLSLPNALWNLFPKYKHLFYQRSQSCCRDTVTLTASREV